MNTSPSRPYLPVLLLLFAGSGCAALIYEIVWFQLLQLVIGSSALSLGVLLGTFMGGMCIGSLALPRIISAKHHPLKVYAMLEAAIGIIGIVVLFAVPLAGGIYTEYAGHGFVGILLRAVLAGLFLLPPTILMGATLPAISRWIETDREGISWLGFFYAGNIGGAVVGCVVAGFYLLRVYNMPLTTYVAAAINATVAIIGFVVATRTAPVLYSESSPAGLAAEAAVTETSGALAVYLTIALSGLSALGAEVIWTRNLSLLLGATVYTFSIILAVFLIGLGIGSSAGGFLSRNARHPGVALGMCQVFLTLAIAWTAWVIADSLPYWPVMPNSQATPWQSFQLDFARCLWAILPAAILWGASFPLALAAVARRADDPGKLVGGVYAANTVGAIIGSLAFSGIFIPWLGTRQSQRMLILVAALSGLIILGEHALRMARTSRRSLGANLAAMAAAAAMAVVLAGMVPSIPGLLVAYGRSISSRLANPPEILYVGEGMNSSVAVSEWSEGTRNFHVAGKVEASSDPVDMRLQRMLGHLSALVHPEPKSVLIVGFGAGVTAGTFVQYPGIKRIVICEIEPLIPQVVSTYFSRQNHNVLHDPRVEVVYDDARHFILTTKEKFDIITSDPIHPWVKGAATLYTTEYFEMAKKHLNPGGVISQWVPLYDSTADVVKSEFATFFKAFPNGTVWNNDNAGRGYDVVLIGNDGPTKIDINSLVDRLSRPDYQAVVTDLEEVGFSPPLTVLHTYGGQGPDLQPWLRDAQINTDSDLRLQYLAGLEVSVNDPDRIYQDFLTFRQFPENLFSGPPESLTLLRQILMQ